MTVEMHVVDAFTEQLFGGNPAAVIMTEEWLDDSLMQSIATENNLSETAFLKPVEHNHYQIRWFSPLTEIDFCGHATMASAFVVFLNNPSLSEVKFSAPAVGELIVTKQADGVIDMSFPNRKPEPVGDVPQALLDGLSKEPRQVLRNEQAYFAIYDGEESVRAIEYDSEKLKLLAPFDVVVSSPGKDYDFVSRYFWPANGGDEDPVTGSIHAGLAPYWGEKMSKQELVAFQASQRGGVVHCRLADNRVHVAGKAVLYLKGEIVI
ncbi:PhzF family phenazine biosynthesis protein [Kangiella koreensis]|uniref:Phenazine biosynthesis protein PhzF family n=1 Tax=Kangiella koreensis (strain DSM 16069 / JCM 12317 / KCTC 12182 / SW-125) TaxID=523791 RepID=C7R6L7_KANKD|nr:PhzF family phenazine biosynthesis protein [Kangiella koreensis]ACV25533.1 phenazine biosynthesis protein PhzF family [Kangiella koreensis DSM 16069]